MTHVHAYAANAPHSSLAPFEYEITELKPHDILVKISHCGICHSDMHLLSNDWKVSKYPLVPGHEIVGEILDIGHGVTLHRVRERVGIGWQAGSCGHCEWCHLGEEHVCAKTAPTCVGRYGGFADHIVVNERFAIPIPEALASEHAAPLLCGGGTTFSPLITHHINGLSKVAVIGIGGLGHLALQFAAAFGAEVFAISSTTEKEEEAYHFGATHFICNPHELPARQFDLILNTSPSLVDVDHFMTLLRPKGTFCQLGASTEPIAISPFNLIEGCKRVSGSSIASPLLLKKMLQVAAFHHIKPQIETYPLSHVNQALERLRHNKVRYRAVLCM